MPSLLYIWLCHILVLGTSFLSSDHALYIAKMDVRCQNQDTTKIVLKLFSDDLANALKGENDKISLSQLERLCDFEKEMTTYINENLTVSFDGDANQDLVWTCDQQGDVHVLTSNVIHKNMWSEIQVNCELLLELFPTQKTILSIDHLGTKRWHQFDHKHREKHLTF